MLFSIQCSSCTVLWWQPFTLFTDLIVLICTVLRIRHEMNRKLPQWHKQRWFKPRTLCGEVDSRQFTVQNLDHLYVLVSSAPMNRIPQWPTKILASNHRLSPLYGFHSPVVMLRTCPNMSLAVEWNVKHHFDLLFWTESNMKHIKVIGILNVHLLDMLMIPTFPMEYSSKYRYGV